MLAYVLTAGPGTVDVFANVSPEAEIAAEAAPAEPEVTESVPEILVPAGDTTDPVPDESMPDVVPSVNNYHWFEVLKLTGVYDAGKGML